MNRICLLAICLAGAAFAGPLRFRPDTIRAGDRNYSSKLVVPDTTTVVNTSNTTVTVTLVKSILRLSPSTKAPYATFNVGYQAPNQRGYNYKPDTTIHSGTRYIQPLSRALNSMGLLKVNEALNYSSAEIVLAPNQSIKLSGFRNAACYVPVARALAGTTPVTSCIDEPIDLVFGSTQTGFDTLHTLANHWMSGGGPVVPSTRQHLSTWQDRQFSANGRPSAQNASGISLDPTGAATRLR